MKINPQTLNKILEMTSRKYELDPLKLFFTKDGVIVRQMDSARVMACIAKVDIKAFSEYEELGEISVSAKHVKILKNMFKTDDYIELSKDMDKLVFKGSRETYSIPFTTEEVGIISEDALKQTSYGKILQRSNILKVMKLDLTDMEVEYEDVINLDFSGNDLIVEVPMNVTMYSKVITSKVEKSEQSLSLTKISFDAKILSSIISLIKDVAYLVFTDGPLFIYYHSDVIPMDVTYIIAPRSQS